MDEGLASDATNEGIDDVGRLFALLGEALDVLLESFARLLRAVTQIPRVAKSGVGTLEMPM